MFKRKITLMFMHNLDFTFSFTSGGNQLDDIHTSKKISMFHSKRFCFTLQNAKIKTMENKLRL